ncbi:MAG TPA: peptidylprolyl isomerase [Burkholderiales bacterium]|nr:peptidylprolyl isomerase [Burkholderiales bacterium]
MKRAVLAAALALLPAALPGLAVAQDKPAAPAAKGGAAPKEPPLAKVNGVAVPATRLDLLMQQQRGRGAPDNAQTRQMLKEELVNREVVVQEAQRAGFAKKPEVQTQLDMARQEIMVSAYLRDWVQKHPVSDDEVQAEYDRAKAQTGDKEYRARHILVDSEDEAKSLIGQLKKGASFSELAQKNSKDPGSKERGGDLDWNVPAAFDKTFSDAMVGLDKGKFTEAPVHTRFGYHIIQLDDVRQTHFPALAEVKPRIQQQITQHKIEELVRGLRAKAKVEE